MADSKISPQFQNKVYKKALSLAALFLIFALGSTYVGKTLDTNLETYPKYSLILFFCSFLVSWVVVLLVLRNANSEIKAHETKKQSDTNAAKQGENL